MDLRVEGSAEGSIQITDPEVEKPLIELLNAGFAFGIEPDFAKPGAMKAHIFQFESDFAALTHDFAEGANLVEVVTKLVQDPDAKPGILRHKVRMELGRQEFGAADFGQAEEA